MGIGLARVYDVATTICAENKYQLITVISLAPNVLTADVLQNATCHCAVIQVTVSQPVPVLGSTLSPPLSRHV